MSRPSLKERADNALRLTLTTVAIGLVLYAAFHVHELFQANWGKGRETAIETALEQREQLVEIETEIEAWESTLDQERPDVTDRRVGLINDDVSRIRSQAKALCSTVTEGPPSPGKDEQPRIPTAKQRRDARALVKVFEDAYRRWNTVMWETGDFGPGAPREPGPTQALWDSADRTLRPEPAYGPRDETNRLPSFVKTVNELAATCALIRLDRILWDEHGVDVGRDSFAATLADARARTEEAKQELDRLTKRRDELREKQKGDIGAISKSTNRLVVEQLPLAMLLILGFGIALLLAARTLGQRGTEGNGGGTELSTLISSGQLLQFSTVVILFTLVLVLALAGSLEPDHTATLLASVAGYLLGTGIGSLGKRGPETADAQAAPAAVAGQVGSAPTTGSETTSMNTSPPPSDSAQS